MLNYIMRKILGTKNERELRRFAPRVQAISSLEPEISKLTDAELRGKTDKFRKMLADGQSVDDILNEVFAVVREVGKRTVKMRPFDVQLMGGMVLHDGKIAEMATGEGKTLVATLPIYLNALSGKGAHLVTVNDYLARRDRNWMGPIYEFLGLSVGAVQHDMDHAERKQAYFCDVTYGTNNEFGFDYLRDNMCSSREEKVQRAPNYAIVDEVDSILVDEARTPLIISGPAEESTDKYYKIDKVIPRLKKAEDYEVDEKVKNVHLTDEGIRSVEKILGIDSLYDNVHMEIAHHVVQALRAHELYKRDVDYMVKDGEVVIVDDFTGRLMPGRRWSDGLHQAIEAKEGVRIERENQTLATITFQNYFRMYEKLAGMTGTAETEAQEFFDIYKLDVIVIPTNKPLIRHSHPDVIYKTEKEKFNAVCNEIEGLNKEGRPVLVGTISIENSERLSRMLQNRNIFHHVLNAKYHEQEAEIIVRAGQTGAVTIATNMAGRGTDIVLGEGVAGKGGLHVLGTERHEARRIDNQLRGRAGRQGDPGSSRFYLSLKDDLLRVFGSDRIAGVMDKLGLEEGQDIQHPLITKSIETAQRRVEGHNFDIRKQLLKFDDVMNKQREVIYAQRDMIFDSSNLKEDILGMASDLVEDEIAMHCSEEIDPKDWEISELFKWLKRICKISIDEKSIKKEDLSKDSLQEMLMKVLHRAYDEKESQIGLENMRNLERAVMLRIVDMKWKDHLYAMDNLREGIHLRAYGQKDPLIEYQQEGYEMFQTMIGSIKEDVVGYIFKMQMVGEAETKASRGVFDMIPQETIHAAGETMHDLLSRADRRKQTPEAGGAVPGLPPEEKKAATYKRDSEKVGRNDPCSCGSGKKYKKCCGR